MGWVLPVDEDTTIYLPIISGPQGVSYSNCGCSITDGQSCRYCDGTEAEWREAARDAAMAHRRTPKTPMTPEQLSRWLPVVEPEGESGEG